MINGMGDSGGLSQGLLSLSSKKYNLIPDRPDGTCIKQEERQKVQKPYAGLEPATL